VAGLAGVWLALFRYWRRSWLLWGSVEDTVHRAFIPRPIRVYSRWASPDCARSAPYSSASPRLCASAL